MAEVATRPAARERLVRYRNPLLFLGVVVLVAATFSYRNWRASLRDLPIVAELGRTEGLAALDAGEFSKAEELLSKANLALNTLGDAVEGASAIRQGAQEVAIIINLAGKSLEEMFQSAYESGSTKWEAEFKRQYQGHAIIIDSHITKVPDSEGRGDYDLEYRIFRNEGLNVARIDLKGFQRLDEIKPSVGDHVIFGARLASFRRDPDSEDYLVGLEPSSGVMITRYKALEILGWPRKDLEPSEEERP